MADNIVINQNTTTGSTVAAKEIGSTKHQRTIRTYPYGTSYGEIGTAVSRVTTNTGRNFKTSSGLLVSLDCTHLANEILWVKVYDSLVTDVSGPTTATDGLLFSGYIRAAGGIGGTQAEGVNWRPSVPVKFNTALSVFVFDKLGTAPQVTPAVNIVYC